MRFYRKIFPPTAEEVGAEEKVAEEENEVKEPMPVAVGKQAVPGEESQAKKAKTGSEDLDTGWEDVEKPSETTEGEKATDISEEGEKATDISEEGEKVEAPELGGSDGEKVERPGEKEQVDELAESGEVLPKSSLLKDW